MEFKKEILNRNRVLTMSTNRKGDYLIVDPGFKKITVMVVKSQNRNVNDIIFIKQISSKLIDEIFDICFEFNVFNILIDINGIGLGIADAIMEYIGTHDTKISGKIIKVKKNINNELVYIYQDIQNGKLRFLQSVNCAKTSYKKAFLGYSEIINCHRETDKLIDEISSIKLKMDSSGIVKLDSNIEHSRFNCLSIYYSIYDS